VYFGKKAGLIELRNDNGLYWRKYDWYKNELHYKAKIEHSKSFLELMGGEEFKDSGKKCRKIS
jgi:hypothetical protein